MVPCAQWVSDPRRDWAAVADAAETVFWTIVVLVTSTWERLDHFTWWAVLLQLACVAAGRGFRSSLVVHALVVGGVWVMSAAGCDMLVDTEADVGFASYAGGNFVVHYLPFVSALSRVTAGDTCTPLPMLLWLLYIAHIGDVTTEYGCANIDERYARLAGCFLVACMAAV